MYDLWIFVEDGSDDVDRKREYLLDVIQYEICLDLILRCLRIVK
jgi:hypothetical protein